MDNADKAALGSVMFFLFLVFLLAALMIQCERENQATGRDAACVCCGDTFTIENPGLWKSLSDAELRARAKCYPIPLHSYNDRCVHRCAEEDEGGVWSPMRTHTFARIINRSFDQKVNTFHLGQYEAARWLCREYHYSKTFPFWVKVIATDHAPGGLFGDFGPPIAACCIGVPPTKWTEPVGELKRLVRLPEYDKPLTQLISFSCEAAKRCGYDLLVSMADSTHGHHGGIYQAASWKYHGKRPKSVDGLIVNGVFVPGRKCNHTWGTRSPRKLQQRYPEWSIKAHWDEGKHLYWRPLSKAGKRKACRLGLTSVEYPKPHVTPNA